MKTMRFIFLPVLALVMLVASGCSTWRATERGLTYWSVPNSVERQLGADYAQEIEGEIPLLDDPEAQAWLDAMCQRLLAHSPQVSHDFQFRITAQRDVNAFAIPGGFCYVNLGLLLYADNEAQVAAVMGHEVNHVTKRHGIMGLQRRRSVLTATDIIAATFKSDAAGGAARVAGQAGGVLALQRFGRDDEREADDYGLDAMYGAGYDPREGVRFFEKLAALQGDARPSWLDQMLSTHPATSERIARLNARVEREYDLRSRTLIVNTPEFARIQARLRAQYGAAQ